jgi:hypothetical protein
LATADVPAPKAIDLSRSSGEGKGQGHAWPFFVFNSMRREVMASHKFAIGQIVRFDTKVTPLLRPQGPYEVTRVLPAEDAQSQTYRIKSKSEPFERIAKEYEIVAANSPVTEREEIFGGAVGANSAR